MVEVAYVERWSSSSNRSGSGSSDIVVEVEVVDVEEDVGNHCKSSVQESQLLN